MNADPLIEALVALDDAENRIQTAKHRLNEAIIAQAERGPVAIPATRHEVMIPPGAFCCDALDKPGDATFPCYCAETSVRNCPRHAP